MKKSLVFYFFCLITAFLFVNSLFVCTKQSIKPTLFSPVYNTVNAIVEMEFNDSNIVLFKINEKLYSIKNVKNILNSTIKENIKTFDVCVKKGYEDKIKSIVIFNDIKTNYFKDFSDFKKEEETFCLNNECSVYTKYEVPKSVKFNQNSDSYNFNSIQNTICVLISYFTTWHKAFFFTYIFLFIAIIYYTNNKNEIKTLKIKDSILSVVLFISAILMYSNGLLDYLPWMDEYSTIEYSNPKEGFLSILRDPGNPPLFYFLFKIFISLFGISTLTMRVFPFIISVLFFILFYLFLKNRYGTKAANIGAFLSCINIPLIYFAQETRSYIFQAFMTPVLVYFLFKILEENKKKDYLIYGILVAIASNIHYYEILLLVSNYVFLSILFLIKKRHKDLLWFTLANITGALFFLPFFCYTAFNKALIDSDFNNWIPDISFFQITKCICYIFGGIFSFILSICFFVKQFFRKEKDLLIIYSFFAIIFTILQAIILSYTIRPMLVERYLVLLSPLVVIFLTGVFISPYKKKYMSIFFIIWILFMQAGSFEKNNRRKGIIELPLSFSKEYFKKEAPKNNIYAIINIANLSYLENKEKFVEDEITYVSKSIFTINETIDEILEKDEKATIFTSILEPTSEVGRKKENYSCFFNSSTDTCLWKITN